MPTTEGGNGADVTACGVDRVLVVSGAAAQAASQAGHVRKAADTAKLWSRTPADTPAADRARVAIALVGKGSASWQEGALVARRRDPRA